MTSNGHVNIASERRIALLIDADNVSHEKIATILAELSRHGTAHIRRAYGDWSRTALKGWRERLHSHAIRPIQQFSYSAGKNATDIALVIDAMELLYTQKLDAFCIASSDGDFTPLVMQLKANGHDVYGFGDRKTPDPFVNACTSFLYLDSTNEPQIEADTEPSVESKAATPAKRASPAPKTAKPARTLAQDTKLVTILRGAVEATARDDGWASMAAAGGAVKRQAPIDPRNYGMKNFTALFEGTGLFVMVKADSGQVYIADKRNRDRTPKPTI